MRISGAGTKRTVPSFRWIAGPVKAFARPNFAKACLRCLRLLMQLA